MGKKLVMLGADFSANGMLYQITDITSSFSWETGTFDGGGVNKASNAFDRSNAVDISSYVGHTMRVAWCDYKTSGGEQATYYGLIFLDADSDVISISKVPLGTGSNSMGKCLSKDITIPNNAVTFKTTYIKSSYCEGEFVNFYCKILPL